MSCMWERGSSSGSDSQKSSSPSWRSRRVATASRMSVSALRKAITSGAPSSTSMTRPEESPTSAGSPASSSTATTVAALPALLERSSDSVNRRNSAAASSSSRYADGSSRASTGSSGTLMGPLKSRSASKGSTSVVGTPPSSRSSSMSWEASERRRSASNPVRVATAPPPRRRWKPSVIHALQRGPEAVVVHRADVALHLLAGAGGDDRLAVVVDLEHELLRAGPAVAEVLLEDEGHVRHEVDRVVPDDRLPGPVEHRGLIEPLLLDRYRRGHGPNPSRTSPFWPLR